MDSKPKIVPKLHYVLAKITKRVEQTASKIIVPSMSLDEKGFIEGEVLAVGPSVESFQAGQTILAPTHWSSQLFWNGIEYLLCEEKHIRATIE